MAGPAAGRGRRAAPFERAKPLIIDVAVVGAGPAGLHAAKQLAESGLEVRVFEEHATVGSPTHCTGIVSLELTEFAKLPEELIVNRLRHARLRGPGGGTCDIAWNFGAAEEIVVIDRQRFDESLATAAVAAGAKLQMSTPVRALALEETAVRVEVDGGAVRARTCIVASGVSYRFHRQLGLGLPGDVLHTAQVEVDAAPTEHVDIHIGREIAPEGFVWAVPVARGGRARLRVGILARGPAATLLQRFLDGAAVRHGVSSSAITPITRLLPVKPVPRSYLDRVLLVGDAGGFTKPTTGGGIFYSMLTASLAAETLVEAFRADRFDDDMLGRYQRRWYDRLGHDMRVSEWLRHLTTRCTDTELDHLVDALAADDVQAVIRRAARFNWHRGVIVALLRERGVAGLLFRSLLR